MSKIYDHVCLDIVTSKTVRFWYHMTFHDHTPWMVFGRPSAGLSPYAFRFVLHVDPRPACGRPRPGSDLISEEKRTDSTRPLFPFSAFSLSVLHCIWAMSCRLRAHAYVPRRHSIEPPCGSSDWHCGGRTEAAAHGAGPMENGRTEGAEENLLKEK